MNAGRQRTRTAWLFLTPTLAVLLLSAAWPLGRTLWFSLTDALLDDLDHARFIGLGNFELLFSDPEWWTAVGNTLWFAAVSVGLETLLGLGLALALRARFPGRWLLQGAVLIPWAIPTIVAAQIWAWMLHDQFGLINHLLQTLGMIGAPVAWTANPDTALWAIVAADVWKTTPFMTILILAGLQMLPGDCFEAARVDGVHPVRIFFRLTLPLLAPTLAVAMVFRGLDALRVFDMIYVLTGDNPQTASISTYARRQLVAFQDVGLGSAAASMLFLFMALAAVIHLARRRGGAETI